MAGTFIYPQAEAGDLIPKALVEVDFTRGYHAIRVATTTVAVWQSSSPYYLNDCAADNTCTVLILFNRWPICLVTWQILQCRQSPNKPPICHAQETRKEQPEPSAYARYFAQ